MILDLGTVKNGIVRGSGLLRVYTGEMVKIGNINGQVNLVFRIRTMHHMGKTFLSSPNRMGLYKQSVLNTAETLFNNKSLETYTNLPVVQKNTYFYNKIALEIFKPGTEIATQLDILYNFYPHKNYKKSDVYLALEENNLITHKVSFAKPSNNVKISTFAEFYLFSNVNFPSTVRYLFDEFEDRPLISTFHTRQINADGIIINYQTPEPIFRCFDVKTGHIKLTNETHIYPVILSENAFSGIIHDEILFSDFLKEKIKHFKYIKRLQEMDSSFNEKILNYEALLRTNFQNKKFSIFLKELHTLETEILFKIHTNRLKVNFNPEFYVIQENSFDSSIKGNINTDLFKTLQGRKNLMFSIIYDENPWLLKNIYQLKNTQWAVSFMDLIEETCHQL